MNPATSPPPCPCERRPAGNRRPAGRAHKVSPNSAESPGAAGARVSLLPPPAPSPCPGRQQEKVLLTAAETRENQPQQPQPRPERHRRAEPPLPPPPLLPPPPGGSTAAGRWKKFSAGGRRRRRGETSSSLRSGFGLCHAPGSAPSRRRYDTRPLTLSPTSRRLPATGACVTEQAGAARRSPPSSERATPPRRGEGGAGMKVCAARVYLDPYPPTFPPARGQVASTPPFPARSVDSQTCPRTGGFPLVTQAARAAVGRGVPECPPPGGCWYVPPRPLGRPARHRPERGRGRRAPRLTHRPASAPALSRPLLPPPPAATRSPPPLPARFAPAEKGSSDTSPPSRCPAHAGPAEAAGSQRERGAMRPRDPALPGRAAAAPRPGDRSAAHVPGGVPRRTAGDWSQPAPPGVVTDVPVRPAAGGPVRAVLGSLGEGGRRSSLLCTTDRSSSTEAPARCGIGAPRIPGGAAGARLYPRGFANTKLSRRRPLARYSAVGNPLVRGT